MNTHSNNLFLEKSIILSYLLIFSTALLGQYQVFWSDINGLNYNTETNVLSFDSRATSFGHAFSLNELSVGMAEHISFTAPTNAKLTVGFVHTNTTYQHDTYNQNYEEIEYGFHLENNEAVIVNEGVTLPVFGPDPYNSTQVFEITYNGEQFIFDFNGVEVYRVGYSVTASLRLEVLFTDLDASFDPPSSDRKSPLAISYATTEQDHDKGGSIEVTAIGGKRPYRYIWNSAPFVDKETFDLFIPSFYGELAKAENSHIAAQFDRSRVITYDEFVELKAKPKISNLQSGSYKLKLVDAENTELEENISVSAQTNWPSSSDYSFANKSLTKLTTQADLLNVSAATSDNILYPGKDGRFSFNLPLPGTQKVIGLRDGDITPSDYRNTQFGFYIEGSDIYLFKDGVVEGGPIQAITANDKFSILREGNSFSARINDVEVGSYTDASPAKLKRFDVYMTAANDVFVRERVYNWWYVPLMAIEEEVGVCGLKSSDIIAGNRNQVKDDFPYPVTFTWTDNHGSTAYPNSPTLNGVDPGWYRLVANVQHPTHPYSYAVGTYYIGYKVNWMQEVNLINQPTTNSLELNTAANYLQAGILGESNSSNIFDQPDEGNYGWIYTEIPGLMTGTWFPTETDPFGESGNLTFQAYRTGFSVSHYGFKQLPLGNGPMEYGISIVPVVIQSLTPVSEDFLVFLHPAMIPVGYGGPTQFAIETGDKVVQLIDRDKYLLYINGDLKVSFTIAGLSAINFMNIKGEVSVNYGNLLQPGGANYLMHDQVLNCLASFKCRDQSYNLLASELRAEFYNTINGNLYFQFQGEYNYGVLDYVIKDLDGNDVTANTIISATDKDYGDNRYILNMNQLSDGYYTLTVTNEKEENYTLRIHKEY